MLYYWAQVFLKADKSYNVYMDTLKRYIFLLSVGLIILGILFFIPVYGQTSPSTFLPSSFKRQPFGGKILTKIVCDCGLGSIVGMFGSAIGINSTLVGLLEGVAKNSLPNPVWITVGPPVGGSYMVVPGTKIYREYQIEVGRWVLGNSIPTMVPCIKKVGPICAPAGAGFPITIVGTSGFFGGFPAPPLTFP